ncbi:MAG: helix-turn-helix domain-containing protein [Crocosphaera sp.]|nr:helix-turn-helix domain-containing protein [Crocosphaera sp.]
MSFVIISPTPGLTTSQRILELILNHPQGITVKDLSDGLNRPISMIQYCLKDLKEAKLIQAKFNEADKKWVYYSGASLDPKNSFVPSFFITKRDKISKKVTCRT